MKWTECAIQDLRKYNYLVTSIENIPKRIEALEYAFENIKGATISPVPIKGGTSQHEDKLLDNIVERQRLQMLYTVDKMLLDIIERGLNALDENERLVLERFYINRHKDHVERLMEELNYEKSAIYELKDRALYKFTIAMYGIMEY